MKILARFLFLTGLMFSFLLISCSATKINSKKDNEVKMETVEEKKPVKRTLLGCTTEKYELAKEASIVSLGNNYRIKKFIEKLEKGETVRVAIIGGSVTEGAGIKDNDGKELWQQGYAFQFKEKLEEKYPSANIIFNGAGLSGTPSLLGMIRYENHIVKELGGEPDLLVIEYAVNDGGEPEFNASTEALVRNVYKSSEDAAVILLYADARSYKNSQENKKLVGAHYKVPQISIQDVVENPTFGIIEDFFFDDYVHPKKPGHTLMTDCLMHLLDKEAAATIDAPIEVPEVLNPSMNFEEFHAVFADSKDKNVKVTTGGFGSTDSNSQSLKKGGAAFPVNWHHAADSGNGSLKFELNCKNLVFVYKVQGNWLQDKFGTAEVYVDGKKFADYDGADKGGWNNSVQIMLINETSAANHKVEVRMAEGSENLGFTVLALGYSK